MRRAGDQAEQREYRERYSMSATVTHHRAWLYSAMLTL